MISSITARVRAAAARVGPGQDTQTSRDLQRPDSEKGVQVRGLTRRYGARTVLQSLDLTVNVGEFVVLLGKSGSGKSTILRAIADLDPGVEGSGVIETPDSSAVVFQDARLLPWLHVLDNVRLGLKGADRTERATAALAEVGLSGRERAWPNELSGGEQQRVALARALVRQPQLILADEPFGALDALTRLTMQSLLIQLFTAHRPAVVLVTHDVNEAVQLGDRAIVLADGRFALDVPISLPRPRSLAHPDFLGYRAALLDALGVNDGT